LTARKSTSTQADGIQGKGRQQPATGSGSWPEVVRDPPTRGYLLDEAGRHRDARRPELWLGKRGVLQIRGINRMVKSRGEQAGIDGAGPRPVRHTFVEQLIATAATAADLMVLIADDPRDARLLRQRDQRERARAAYERGRGRRI